MPSGVVTTLNQLVLHLVQTVKLDKLVDTVPPQVTVKEAKDPLDKATNQEEVKDHLLAEVHQELKGDDRHNLVLEDHEDREERWLLQLLQLSI